jgi:hypothetical protein
VLSESGDDRGGKEEGGTETLFRWPLKTVLITKNSHIQSLSASKYPLYRKLGDSGNTMMNKGFCFSGTQSKKWLL